MKKIFLTSGIVLCMACPAFATANDINYDQQNSSYALANNAGDPSCQEPTLGTYTEDTTFRAKWEANTYHITFARNTKDANNATLVTQSGDPLTPEGQTGDTNQQQSFVYAATTQLANNGYSAAGYQFGGWTSNHDLETVEGAAPANPYANGASINPYLYPHSDATLTAIWNPIKSGAITLNSSVYSGNSHTGTATYTTSTTGNDAVTAPTTATVYTVYNTGMYSDSTAETAVVAANLVPSKIGYTFGGFYGKFTNNDADETQFIDATGNPTAAGKRAVNAANGTAEWFANWSAKPHTISYECGDKPGTQNLTAGSEAPSTVNINYDGSYTLPTSAGTCEYKGWHFAGWKCNYALGTVTAAQNEASTSYTNLYAYANDAWTNNNGTGTFKVDNNVTCKAMWTQNEIELTWLAGEGAKVSDAANAADYTTVTTNAATCIYDGDLTPGAAPYRTGYTFTGWTTQEEAPQNAGYVIFPEANSGN